MSIITISRGTYSKGKEVAEGVAEKLHYETVSREILLAASQEFDIPSEKLTHAIHDPPTLYDRLTHHHKQYLNFIRYALLEHVRSGNVVYHGLAGHFLLGGIDEVLNVRIIASLEYRIAEEVEREGIDEDEARLRIVRDDEERRKWTKMLYGVDIHDPGLYGLVISVDKVGVDRAIHIICDAAASSAYRFTDEVHQRLEDMARACYLQSCLVELVSDLTVTSSYGNVVVHANVSGRTANKLDRKVQELAEKVEGVHKIEVHGD